jgi:hypothetical protein
MSKFNIAVVVVFVASSLWLFPSIVVHILILIDYFTPFDAFKSPLALRYHDFLVNALPDVPEKEPLILTICDVDKDSFKFASRGYTVPVVIRNAVGNSTAVKKWGNVSWWVNTYGQENVLCKGSDTIEPINCSIEEALLGKSMYISGETNIFTRHKELHDDLSTSTLDNLFDGRRVFTQIFMGYGGMGSDVHSAMGCNMFSQIVGSKTWYIFPNSQTPYLIPSMNPNGLSAYTLTRIGKGSEDPSPWVRKLERYVVTLHPGDVLLDSPWFWHAVINNGSPDDLVLGVPTRYATPLFRSSFRNNWVLSLLSVLSITTKFGMERFLSSPDKFQSSLESSRESRAKSMAGERAMKKNKTS